MKILRITIIFIILFLTSILESQTCDPQINLPESLFICAGSSTGIGYGSGCADGTTQVMWSEIGCYNDDLGDTIPLFYSTYSSGYVYLTIRCSTDTDTCSECDSVYFAVNNPDIIAEDDTAICSGNSVTLNSTGSGCLTQFPSIVYWYLLNSNYPFASGYNVNVSPASTTSYVVQLTCGGSTIPGQECFDRDTVTVTVATGFVNPAYDTICSGDSITLISILNCGGGNSTINWRLGSKTGIIIGNNDTLNYIPVSSGWIYAEMLCDTTDCTIWDSAYIKVYPVPVTQISEPNDTLRLCPGSEIQLIANQMQANACVDSSYWYDLNNIAPVVAGDTLDFSTKSYNSGDTIIYVAVDTCFYGCSSRDTITIIILNGIYFDIPDTGICIGDTLVLDMSLYTCPSETTKYEWFKDDTTTAPISTNPVLTITNLSQPSVFYGKIICEESPQDCYYIDRIEVGLEGPNIDIGDTIRVCLKSSNIINLNASADACTLGNTNHRWFNSSWEQIGSSDTLIAQVNGPTYIYLLTDCGNPECPDTDTFVIRLKEIARIYEGYNKISCKRETQIGMCYTCSTGTTTNEWYRENPDGSRQFLPLFYGQCRPSVPPGTYIQRSWCAEFDSCYTEARYSIFAKKPSRDTVLNDTSICKGKKVKIDASKKKCENDTTFYFLYSSPDMDSLISWNKTGIFETDRIYKKDTFYVLTTCSYDPKNEYECGNIEDIKITVIKAPSPSIKDQTICRGDSVIIDLSKDTCDIKPATNYEWYKNSLSGQPVSRNAIFNTGAIDSVTTFYLITYCGVNRSCADTNRFTISTVEAPEYHKIEDLTICKGGLAKLDASVVKCKSWEKTFHNWYPGNNIQARPLFSGNVFSFNAEKNDSFYVISHCGAEACADTQKVYVFTTPPPSLPDYDINLSDTCLIEGDSIKIVIEFDYIEKASFFWTGDFSDSGRTITAYVKNPGTYRTTFHMIKDNCERTMDFEFTFDWCPLFDIDQDNIPDRFEDKNGNGIWDPDETNPCDRDSDDDGIMDGDEDKNHNGKLDPGETNPKNPDSDNDGLPDGLETGIKRPVSRAGNCSGTDTTSVNFKIDNDPSTKTNPLSPDTDKDICSDGVEDINKNGRADLAESDAVDTDSDDDGVKDGDEFRFGNLCNEDFDNDGKINSIDWDSDNDNLPDGLERGITSPVPPGCETCEGTYVRSQYWIPDEDPKTTTDPFDSDTDDDTCNDGMEDLNRNGKVDAGETNPDNPDDCVPDADRDGIPDFIEDSNHNEKWDSLPGETNWLDRDTDDDGLMDGEEDLNSDGKIEGDLNENRIRDNDEEWTETDPLSGDTDKDFLMDGTESGITEPILQPSDCIICKGTNVLSQNWKPDSDQLKKTNPLNNNTDSDFCLDAQEDLNKNGKYEPDLLETDPNNPDDCAKKPECGKNSVNVSPNPFFPGHSEDTLRITKINFTLCSPSKDVKIEIYDLFHTHLRTLYVYSGEIEHKAQDRFYTAKWDGLTGNGNKLPSGNYIYRIIANNNKEITGIIVLVR